MGQRGDKRLILVEAELVDWTGEVGDDEFLPIGSLRSRGRKGVISDLSRYKLNI